MGRGDGFAPSADAELGERCRWVVPYRVLRAVETFGALADIVTAGLDSLEAAGLVRRGTDPIWRAYAVLFIMLGPVMLSRQLEARLDTDAFHPAVGRSSCNIDLLRHGLFTASPTPRRINS